jgi:hypothetical protein
MVAPNVTPPRITAAAVRRFSMYDSQPVTNATITAARTAIANQIPRVSSGHREQLGQHLAPRWGVGDVGVADAVHPAGAVGDRAAGVDQAVQQRLAGSGVDHGDLDHVPAASLGL